VDEAVHDSQPSDAGCMPGTRVGVLSKFVEWVKTDPKSILWLAGMAGTGKSSIALTLCRMLQEDPDVLLGGTFFCSRTANEEGRADVRRIIPTLSALLADVSPKFAAELAAELKPGAGAAVRKPASEQIGPLLQHPLAALASESRPIVFVIDALDECSDEREMSALLKAIAGFKCTANVKFVLTSRPETHILGNPITDQALNEILHLHTIGSDEVLEDIRMYINNMFTQHPLPGAEPWYSDADVFALANLANGLFIFASTAIEYILDTASVDHRKDRLRTTLSAMKNSKVATGPLDKIYEFVITRASNATKVEPHELAQTRQVLSCILVARMPLSLSALAELLDAKIDVIRASLHRLRAVVHVPDELDQPGLRVLHASFGDYLFERASVGIRVSRENGEETMARNCLRVLSKRLHFNVSQSRSSYLPNSSSKPDFIPLALEYACLQWIYHVSSSSKPTSFDESMTDTFTPRLLFWLEIMSVLGHIWQATAMLMLAAATVRFPFRLGNKANTYSIKVRSADLSQFFRDANFFVASSREAIERSAPHIYLSALPLAAKDSLVYQTFIPICKGIISVETHGIDRHGGRLAMTLSGHEAAVTSAEYSPDGSLICSSSLDGTVRVWDPRTGDERMSPLRSGDGEVHSVAFAPDSCRIASGTELGVVCVWNICDNQTNPRRLVGHSGPVSAVVFSPDGALIASASADTTVRLWSADTGEVLKVLINHTMKVSAIAFSPGGTVLASGSEDKSLRMWHVETGEPALAPIDISRGVRGISFSPDGTTIAASYFSERIRLWNAQTGMSIASLEGHLDTATCVRFAPNGESIVACGDGMIAVYSQQRDTFDYSSVVIRDDPLWVNTVAYSPDGLYIVSASDDSNVHVWNIGINLEAIAPLQAHEGSVSSVSISPNGAAIISSSVDMSVCVWDVHTGLQILPPLLGHVDAVDSVTISLDGRFIASGSLDSTVRLWDARTGAPVGLPLLGHAMSVNTVSFSPDSRLLASASNDKTIRIWDVATGQLAIGVLHCKHSLMVFAFSSDGLLLAAGGRGGSISLWNAGTGLPACSPLEARDSTVLAISFSPDSRHIASGDGSSVIRVWDIDTRQQASILKGHTRPVYSVAYSSDSRFIVSGSADTTIRLWDSVTGSCLSQIYRHGHSPVARSILFTPDCRFIVAGLANTTICVWDVAEVLGTEGSRSIFDPIEALAFTEIIDEWLVGPSGELLLWVPSDYLTYLQAPVCKTLIARHRVVITSDPSGLHAGEDWIKCWGSTTML